LSIVGRFHGRPIILVETLPLVGHIAFGIIDRGTNVLQVRPTTLCPLSCVFCSVDAGPRSRFRASEFVVERSHLVKWVKHVVRAKDGEVVEALIDGVGDPASYSDIVELVAELKRIVPRVAMETHGAPLSVELVKKLESAGLDRLNLSIDTLDPEKARYLQGAEWFDVTRVAKIAEYVARETSIDLHITPVWIPGVNDEDIERIIEWGLAIGAGKRFPPFGIQKYEVHRFGRKVPGVREPSWREFWRFIERLEARYGVVLDYRRMIDRFGFRRVRRYPRRFRAGDEVLVEVVCPGWLKNEVIAVDREWSCVVTVVGVRYEELRRRSVKVRIIRDKDCIYVAKPAR